jgi:hypothetical protein
MGHVTDASTLGTEVISAMREKALASANLYPKQPDREAEAGTLG